MTRAEFLAAVAATHGPHEVRAAEQFADDVDQANRQLPSPKYDYATAVVVPGRMKMVMSEATAATEPIVQRALTRPGVVYGRWLVGRR